VPQFIISYLYLSFNGLYTSMLLSSEWSSCASYSKGLRVASPIGSTALGYSSVCVFWPPSLATITELLYHLVGSARCGWSHEIEDSTSACCFSLPPLLVVVCVFSIVLFVTPWRGSEDWLQMRRLFLLRTAASRLVPHVTGLLAIVM
jgi:hypothetical protein